MRRRAYRKQRKSMLWPLEFLNSNVRGKTLLTGVNVGVFLHVRLLMESFSAKLAREGASVAVDQQMCGQRTWSFECFIALFALLEKKKKTSIRNWMNEKRWMNSNNISHWAKGVHDYEQKCRFWIQRSPFSRVKAYIFTSTLFFFVIRENYKKRIKFNDRILIENL